ncbi:hypothetical protein PUN28_019853 [Cardiocondyla obscurior]|uniref:Uncharacterized protein n=1 Tax=Cardiocondyla obscurior TaxID=286306 RepID=A0AAW2E8K6_9HYME
MASRRLSEPASRGTDGTITLWSIEHRSQPAGSKPTRFGDVQLEDAHHAKVNIEPTRSDPSFPRSNDPHRPKGDLRRPPAKRGAEVADIYAVGCKLFARSRRGGVNYLDSLRRRNELTFGPRTTNFLRDILKCQKSFSYFFFFFYLGILKNKKKKKNNNDQDMLSLINDRSKTR